MPSVRIDPRSGGTKRCITSSWSAAVLEALSSSHGLMKPKRRLQMSRTSGGSGIWANLPRATKIGLGNFPRIHTQEATALIRAMVGGRVDARKTCRMSGSPRSTVRKERLTIREWGAIICHLVVIVTDAPTSVLQ